MLLNQHYTVAKNVIESGLERKQLVGSQTANISKACAEKGGYSGDEDEFMMLAATKLKSSKGKLSPKIPGGYMTRR